MDQDPVTHWAGNEGAVDGSMTLARRKGTGFWSNGSAWGTCRMTSVGKKTRVELSVSSGSLKLARFTLERGGTREFKALRNIAAGKRLRFSV